MCTLTYLLNDKGYELYFNRDEQRSRALALPPQLDESRAALFPIDPQGGGTWLAVNKQGMSLALLNNYQATTVTNLEASTLINSVAVNSSAVNSKQVHTISRGQIILSLLSEKKDIATQLQTIDLTVYQPFQLCVFPHNLSKKISRAYCAIWDGKQLVKQGIDAQTDLPITSSSIDFTEVSKKRTQRFTTMVDLSNPLASQFQAFHYSTEEEGKHSVNMQRVDAKTVSISRIVVNTNNPDKAVPSSLGALPLLKNDIRFEYFDNVQFEQHAIAFAL